MSLLISLLIALIVLAIIFAIVRAIIPMLGLPAPWPNVINLVLLLIAPNFPALLRRLRFLLR